MTSESLQTGDDWNKIRSIAFFAIPADYSAGDATVAVFERSAADRGGVRLTTNRITGGGLRFYALPADPDRTNEALEHLTALYECHDDDSGQVCYRTTEEPVPDGFVKSGEPICFVWKAPNPHAPVDPVLPLKSP